MTTYGYARVSTRPSKSRKTQHVENQVERLLAEGVDRKHIYTDKVTGTKASRPEWDKLLAVLKPGDTLLFTKLDRIGRSLINLVDVLTMLGDRGVQLRALDQGVIDTTNAHGKLLMGLLALFAEYERNMIAERTVEGLAGARERHGGTLPVRGPAITQDQITTARMLADNGMPASRIADVVGVSRATLYRHVLGTAAGGRASIPAGSSR